METGTKGADPEFIHYKDVVLTLAEKPIYQYTNDCCGVYCQNGFPGLNTRLRQAFMTTSHYGHAEWASRHVYAFAVLKNTSIPAAFGAIMMCRLDYNKAVDVYPTGVKAEEL